MYGPKTLLEMVGADTTPCALATSTLLLIDMQMEYVDGKLTLPGVDAAVAEGGRLLARARGAGAPIVHVRHMGKPGGAFDPGGPGSLIADAVAPVDAERVVEKGLPNAFASTDLAEALADIGRKELIVAGFMTHMCVSSTVRAALDQGYRSTVVAAAAGTRDLPRPDGSGVISAADLHLASLAALSDRFAVIAAGADDIPE